LPPDINTSESDFTVRDGKIVFGLTAIKGCGRSATEALVKARKVRGAFKDLFDFCERVDTRAVTQAAMERLIKAGAMDTLGGHRAQLVHVLPRALQAAKDRQEDHRLGQGNLFEGLANGEVHEEVQVEELPDVARWEEREKLAYEKEVLDFYFSSHPLAQYEKDLARLSADKVVELKNVPPGKEVTLGGMIVGLRLMNTKKARNGNSRYARFRFEDLSGSIECVFWPDDYVRYKDEVKEDEPRILKGVIEKVRDDPSLVVSKVMGLEQAQREFARGLFLLMPLSGSDQLLRVDAVAEVLRTTPGHCPVHLVIRDGLGRKAHLKLAQEFWIDPSRYDKDRLEGILGSGTVRLT
jgi:DNA polymerase-3 subunit alpha